jgi:glycosyltransferase involved in cell wall biosynthesis
MLLHQEIKGFEEYTGFKEGIHYTSWRDFEDLRTKIDYYLTNETERIKIASEGSRACLSEHTYDKRMEQLFEYLKTVKPQDRSISGNVICRDEIKTIEQVVETLNEFCDEVIVTDTGSIDSTREKLTELAEKYQKLHVYDFPWTDNFADARNFCMDKSIKQWIFWMDCDDVLPAVLVKSLKNFRNWDTSKSGMYNPQAYKFVCRDNKSNASLHQTRLFRNLPDVEWEEGLHETVDGSLIRLGVQVYAMEDREVVHTGYDTPEKVRLKQMRNIHILEKEMQKRGESPLLWYFFSQCLCSMTEWHRAIIIYRDKILDNKKFKGQLDKDFISYVHWAIGFAYKQIDMQEQATMWLEKSTFIDSYFVRAAMKGFGNAHELLEKFITTKPPMDYPSYSRGWKKEAIDHLVNYYKDGTKKLGKMKETIS